VHGYRDTPVDLLPAGLSPLSDDTGRTVTALTAGTSVSFEVAAVPTSLYTVTASDPGVYSWDASLGDTRVTVQDAVFDWAGQTRVFRLQGTGTDFTLTAVSDMPLTQLELIAADTPEG